MCREGGADKGTRPLLMSFNGGPGSASAWTHPAYTGPKTLGIDEESYPIQSYGDMDKPYSALEVCEHPRITVYFHQKTWRNQCFTRSFGNPAT